MKALLQVHNWCLFTLSSHDGRGSGSPWSHLYTLLVPPARTPPSWLQQLPKAPHWSLGFQSTNSQTRAPSIHDLVMQFINFASSENSRNFEYFNSIMLSYLWAYFCWDLNYKCILSSSRYFLIFTVISYLTFGLFINILFNFQVFGMFQNLSVINV